MPTPTATGTFAADSSAQVSAPRPLDLRIVLAAVGAVGVMLVIGLLVVVSFMSRSHTGSYPNAEAIANRLVRNDYLAGCDSFQPYSVLTVATSAGTCRSVNILVFAGSSERDAYVNNTNLSGFDMCGTGYVRGGNWIVRLTNEQTDDALLASVRHSLGGQLAVRTC